MADPIVTFKELLGTGAIGASLCFVADKFILQQNNPSVAGFDGNIASSLVTGSAIFVGEAIHKGMESYVSGTGLEGVVAPALVGGSQVAVNQFAPFGNKNQSYGTAMVKGALLDITSRYAYQAIVGPYQSLPQA